MTWIELLEQKRVERRPATKQELRELGALARRSFADARLEGMSTDGKYGEVPQFEDAVARWIEANHPDLV